MINAKKANMPQDESVFETSINDYKSPWVENRDTMVHWALQDEPNVKNKSRPSDAHMSTYNTTIQNL